MKNISSLFMVVREEKSFPAIRALHLLVIVSFVLVQPVLDVLSKNPTFFTAHKADYVDIVILTIFWSLILPSLGVLLFKILSRLFRGIFGWIFFCAISALVALGIFTPLMRLVLLDSSTLVQWIGFVGSILAGIMFGLAYFRFQATKSIMTALSPAILIFPAIFLFSSPINNFLLAADLTQSKSDNTKKPSVFFLVFDGLPLVSLLDDRGEVDRVNYPNIARLKSQSYWSTNATAVAEHTEKAVPALLTGMYPKTGRQLPDVTTHPRNIFTAFRDYYDIYCFESVTSLCPESIRANKKEPDDLIAEKTLLVNDFFIVSAHVILPPHISSKLPDISRNWTFESVIKQRIASGYKKRLNKFTPFLSLIDHSNRNRFYYLHMVIPHGPLEYFSTGEIYLKDGNFDWEGRRPGHMPTDNNRAAEIYKRHLLQVFLVDNLVGQLIYKLEKLKLFDESVIVLTSDHGESFQTGARGRDIARKDKKGSKDNSAGIMLVPLLIKLPHQQQSISVGRNVETIDVIPSLADALNINIQLEADGESIFDKQRNERQEKKIVSAWGVTLSDKHIDYGRALRRKISLFGSGTGLDGLFAYHPYSYLYGKQIDINELPNADLEVKISRWWKNKYFGYKPGSSTRIPAQIVGKVVREGRRQPTDLAIVVNGAVRATTTTYLVDDEEHFAVLLPEEVFKRRIKTLDILVIGNDENKIFFRRAVMVE